MLEAAAIGWLVVGGATAVLMARGGHNRFDWALLGLVLGPLVVPLALSVRLRAAPDPDSPRRPGTCDVLVAVDPSAGGTAALEEAMVLVAAKATSITLVNVVDLDAPYSDWGVDAERDAQLRLDGLAARVRDVVPVPVETIVVHGRPAERLAHLAARGGYELVVVGHGEAALGRVARRIAKRAPVPVLIAPTGA